MYSRQYNSHGDYLLSLTVDDSSPNDNDCSLSVIGTSSVPFSFPCCHGNIRGLLRPNTVTLEWSLL